jgi:hypothetical protein
MKTPILSKEQIEEAKFLREQGKTKRDLAIIFNVGPTTIWENVYAKEKIVRIRIKRPKIIYEHCKGCEVRLTRFIKDKSIPTNFQMGDHCLVCYLEQRGLRYVDLLKV